MSKNSFKSRSLRWTLLPLRSAIIGALLAMVARAEPALKAAPNPEPSAVPTATATTTTPADTKQNPSASTGIGGQPQLKSLQQQADQQVKTLAPVVQDATGKAVPTGPDAEFNRLLAQAWTAFGQQRWGAACHDFERAVRMRPKHEDARFGKALCLDREGRPDEAAFVLEALVQADHRLQDTLPMLVGLLYAIGRLETAELYALRMPELAAVLPLESLREARLRQELTRSLVAREPERIWALWQEAGEFIGRCHLADLSLRAGQLLARPAKARSQQVYDTILNACPRLWDARIGAFFGLQALLGQAELNALFVREEGKDYLPASYRAQLLKARLDMLRARLGAVAADSDEAQGLYQAILALAPEEATAALNLAWWHYRRGDNGQALPRFRDLYERHSGDSAALGLTLTLARMGDIDGALDVAHAAALRGLELELLQRRLAGLDATDTLAQTLAARLLTLAPDAPEGRFIIAWQRYHQADFSAAISLFTGLLAEFPERVEYRSGLATAQIAGGQQAEALQTLGGISADHPDLARAAHLAIAESALAHGDYILAESEAHWVLDSAGLDPDHATAPTSRAEAGTEAQATAPEPGGDNGALTGTEAERQLVQHQQAARRVLAFALWKQARNQDALAQFEALPTLADDPDLVNIVSELYREQGSHAEIRTVLARAAQSKNALTRMAAAEQYQRLDWPTHAALTAPAELANPYAGREFPELSYGYWQAGRSGSDNTSALQRQVEHLQAGFSLGAGARCALSYRQEQLDSGHAGANPYVGSEYLRDTGAPKLGLSEREDSDFGLLHCQLETLPLLRVQVGTMPMHGPVDDGQRWRAELAWQNWQISSWFEPLDDSLLAYSGSIDPYTGRAFGGMRERAADLRFARTLNAANWLSAGVRRSEYQGENVIDNAATAADVSFGHFGQNGALAYDFGALAYYRSYDYNSNFYTYGHGGYYSPQQLIGIGPRLRLQMLSSNYAWRLDASLTSYRAQTDSVERFPLLTAAEVGADPDGVRALSFAGSDNSGLSGRVNFNNIWRLSAHWRLAFSANYARAQEYREWWAGLELRYHFGAPGALLADDFIDEKLHQGLKD